MESVITAQMLRRRLFRITALGLAGITTSVLHQYHYTHAIRDWICLPKSDGVILSDENKRTPEHINAIFWRRYPHLKPTDTFLYVQAEQSDNPYGRVTWCLYNLDALQQIHQHKPRLGPNETPYTVYADTPIFGRYESRWGADGEVWSSNYSDRFLIAGGKAATLLRREMEKPLPK